MAGSFQAGTLIPINRKRTTGAKYFIQQQILQNSFENKYDSKAKNMLPIKYLKITHANDDNSNNVTNLKILNTKPNLPNLSQTLVQKSPNTQISQSITPVQNVGNESEVANKSESPIQKNYTSLQILKSSDKRPTQQTYIQTYQKNIIPPQENHMAPPSQKSRKRKRKRKTAKSECYEPVAVPSSGLYLNCERNTYNERNNANYYPSLPSPTSTGSLTQSLFRNKDYQGDCEQLKSTTINLISTNITNQSDKNDYSVLLSKKCVSETDRQSSHSVIDLSSHGSSTIISNSIKEISEHSSDIEIIELSSNKSSTIESENDISSSVSEHYCTAFDKTIIDDMPINLSMSKGDRKTFERESFIFNDGETRKQQQNLSTVIREKVQVNEHLYHNISKTGFAKSNSDSAINVLSQRKHSLPFGKQLKESESVGKCFLNMHLGTEDSSNDIVKGRSSFPLGNRSMSKSSQCGCSQHREKRKSCEFTSVPNFMSMQVQAPSECSQQSSSSNEICLSDETVICLNKITKLLASHYGLPLEDCIVVLQNNVYNILTTMQELQLAAISSPEN